MTRTGTDPLFLEIERFIPLSPGRLFTLWADADDRRAWWGPAEFTCPDFSHDFREGGTWRAVIVGPDGAELPMAGTYREIVPDHRLVFSFAWDGEAETRVTVSFEAVDGGTRQRFHQAPFATAESRDSHATGWGECLDRLAARSAEVTS